MGSSRRLRARRWSTPTPRSTELQEIAKTIDGVNSVSALAGYEVLTEGRGSNAGNLPHQFEALVRAQDDLEADHSGARA